MNILNCLKKIIFSKYAIKRIVTIILVYNFFNNRSLVSYIYGILKSSLYNFMVVESQDDTCTLTNPFFEQKQFMNNKCISCESITELRRVFDTTYEELDINYMKRNIPVIITDAIHDWDTNIEKANVENITQVYMEQSWIYNYIPCDLLSNFDLRTNFLIDYLALFSHPLSDRWFMQWKNCELKAVKVTRNFYEQPYFTKFYLPAAKSNWILMSYRYQTNKYQEVVTENQRLILFMQLRGYFKFKLLPREQCRNQCPVISDVLNESEILVLNTEIWDLEYSPQTDDTSVAVITENEL